MRSPFPRPIDRDFYIVRCFHNGEFYFAERDQKDTHLQDTVEDILNCQIEHIDRVFKFNPSEGWSQDVTADVAEAVAQLAHKEGSRISHETLEFIHQHAERGFALADGLEVA